MKLHLVDTINKRDEFYNFDCHINWNTTWTEIDKIIDKYNYSCIGFPAPEIDKEKHIITIHWFELFHEISIPYIEIIECTDEVIDVFLFRCKKE